MPLISPREWTVHAIPSYWKIGLHLELRMGHDHPTAVKDKILHGLEQPVRRESNSITLLWWLLYSFFFPLFFPPGPGIGDFGNYSFMSGLPFWRSMEFSKKLKEDWARPVQGRSPPWPIDSVYNLHTVSVYVRYTEYIKRVYQTPASQKT